MAQFFKWLKSLFYTRELKVLSYNLSDLQKRIEKSAIEVHYAKGDAAYGAIKRVIETERNIQMLNIIKLSKPDPVLLAHQQGRLNALESMLVFLEDCENPETIKGLKAKEPTKTNVRTLRRQTPSEAVI